MKQSSRKKRSQRGFTLVEVAIAMLLLTTISFVSTDLTAKAMAETNWSTRTALADAYLDREAALMRRLPKQDLHNRGFKPTSNIQTDINLAFNADGSAVTNPSYIADSVTRSETTVVVPGTPGTTNQFTYNVDLVMQVNSFTGAKSYTKSRTVTRTFNN